MASEFVTLADVEAAHRRIAGRIVSTPTVLSAALTAHVGTSVWLKLEHRQTTGSFKLRGASNALALLSAGERKHGVTAASTGNHGRALAYAAKLEGIRSVICMSRLVPENKVSEIDRLGAEIRIIGQSQDDAQAEVDRLVAEEGLAMVPPFDDPAVIAGQGTIGLEMLRDVPEAAAIVVPLSGGGLAAGIAAAAKGLNPAVKVVGVSMTRGAAMKAGLDAGHPVQVEELPTLADSLGGGIGLANRFTFAMVRDLLDEVILVSEAEIAAAIIHAYAQEREIVEGAGAVGIGALLAGKIRIDGPLVILLSGRNIDMAMHKKIISGEQFILGEDAT